MTKWTDIIATMILVKQECDKELLWEYDLPDVAASE